MPIPALYHGTSSFFAAKLVAGCDASPLQTSGALAFASELYDLLVKITGSFISASTLYPIDSGFGGSAPLALKNVHERYNASLMTYGAFYASLNKRIAASYAANNPQGSELLRFVGSTIDALRARGVEEVNHLLGKYPALSRLLLARYCPVILELNGISIDRLLNENGSPFTEESIELYDKLTAMGARVPGSVRIAGSTAPHISRAFRIRVSG